MWWIIYYNLYLTVDEFLQPSEIYVSTLLPWIYKRNVKGIASVSTGGLLRSVAKLLKGDLGAELDATKWKIPSVYGWLFGKAKMPASTILHNFNCGIGMVVVVSKTVWKSNKFVGAIEIGNNDNFFRIFKCNRFRQQDKLSKAKEKNRQYLYQISYPRWHHCPRAWDMKIRLKT